MERRRLLDTELPAGYRRLNYIESTGKEYINSTLPTSQCDGFLLDTMIAYDTDYNNHKQYNCIGSSTSNLSGGTNAKNFIIRNEINSASNSKKFLVGYNGQWLTTGAYVLNVSQRYKIYVIWKYGEQKVYVDDVLKISYSISSSPVNNLPLYVFQNNYNNTEGPGGPDAYPIYRGRIYDLVFFYGSNNVRHFVPAQRNADGVVGMYDLCGTICPLTGTPFYTNAGSGTFIGG